MKALKDLEQDLNCCKSLKLDEANAFLSSTALFVDEYTKELELTSP
jgi:hypothetical protein